MIHWFVFSFEPVLILPGFDLEASALFSLTEGQTDHAQWSLEGDPPPPLPHDIDAFKRLIALCGKRKGISSVQTFFKKSYIPSGELPAEHPC